MIALFSLLLILTLSILITRVATLALAHTGLARQSTQFQARSAFTGVGFATREAEKVVNHPVRRRILMLLMLFGNAGIVTSVASMMLRFVGDSGALSHQAAVFEQIQVERREKEESEAAGDVNPSPLRASDPE